MTKQSEYNSLIGWCLDKVNKPHKRNKINKIKKMNSETDFSSDRNYAEFANEIPFVGDILQPFLLNPFYQLLKYKLKKTYVVLVHSRWPAFTSHNLTRSQLTRWRSWSKAEIWLGLLNSKNASIFTVIIHDFNCYCCKKKQKNKQNVYRWKSVALKKPTLV